VFVVKQQGLVTGVEVDAPHGGVVHAAGRHESEGPVNLLRNLLVAALDVAVRHEAGVPGVDLAQVSKTAGDEGTHQVQGGAGSMVDTEQPLRVMPAGGRGELKAVDGVPAVARQRDAAPGLGVLAAWLRVLTGDTPQLDHRQLCCIGQHDRHRQQHPQLAHDVVGVHTGECLCAVTTLQQERPPRGHLRQLEAQVVTLPGKDERRQLAQPVNGGLLLRRVVVAGLRSCAGSS